MTGTRTPVEASSTRPVRSRVQRACACGDCESCRKKKKPLAQARIAIGAANDRYEREADAVAGRVMADGGQVGGQRPVSVQRVTDSGGDTEGVAPASVEQSIAAPGEPLDATTRGFFEQRFRHEFGHVRVHRDGAAAQSAASISALAYTVGNHIVFGSGRYQPQSRSGKSLLAHELTHVLQQGGSVQRAAISSQTNNARDDESTPALRMQRAAREPLYGEEFSTYPRELRADDASVAASTRRGGTVSHRESLSLLADAEMRERMEADAEAVEQACRARTPPDPVECDPARELGWSDFTGTPPARSRFGAMTAFDLRERAINTADRTCARGGSTLPARGIQAHFDPARSWVMAKYTQASNPTQNGCAPRIRECEAAFAGLTSGQTATYALRPGRGCAAAIQPAGATATNRSECTTVVGADCTTTAEAESGRLLNHERWHFKLACAIARKANGMLATTTDFDGLLRAAQRAANTETGRYDGETGHGCNASQQSTWESDIAAGLPNLTLTVTAPRPRRRRRR